MCELGDDDCSSDGQFWAADGGSAARELPAGSELRVFQKKAAGRTDRD